MLEAGASGAAWLVAVLTAKNVNAATTANSDFLNILFLR